MKFCSGLGSKATTLGRIPSANETSSASAAATKTTANMEPTSKTGRRW
jgi:hypothetical protein